MFNDFNNVCGGNRAIHCKYVKPSWLWQPVNRGFC